MANHGVQVRIVERTHDEMQWVTVQGVGEGGEFPSAHVTGEEQHAFPTLGGSIKILEPVIDNRLAYVLTCISGKQADFGKLAAQRSEDVADNFAPCASTLVGEGQVEVAHPNAAELSVQQVDGLSEGDGHSPSQGTRKRSDRLYHAPR